MNPIAVYVPKPEHFAKYSMIYPAGTAFVTAAAPNAQSAVFYYEGNTYGACNLRAFEERACHAAGRLIERYPTIAKTMIDLNELTLVGHVEKRLVPGCPLPVEHRHLPRSMVLRAYPPHIRKQLEPREEMGFYPGHAQESAALHEWNHYTPVRGH